MAETLISPGVLARESDQSQITSQPIQAGAALIGPTVRGRVNIPTLITTYSQYQATFGAVFESGSANDTSEYTFLTSISAYNYFQNGGTSLIVTRVASGSFTPATSSTIFNDQESGAVTAGSNLFGSYTSGGSNGALFESTATPTTSGAGASIVLAVTASSANGKLSSSAVFPAVTTPGAGMVAATYSTVALVGASGGSGATATVVVSSATVIDSVTINENVTGSDYTVGDTFTIPSGSLGATTSGGTDPIFTPVAADFFVETTGVQVTTAGTGYAVGDTLTVAAGDMGTPGANLVLTLVDANIVDGNAFTLETFGQGQIMNSEGGLNSLGALANGTSNNLRWQVTSPDTGSGTFSVIIRRGNDTSRAPAVLESFNGVSLDPTSPNYISRIIGDQTEELRDAGTADPYLQVTGMYPNASRYVRVKSVNFKTPNYFDNSGTAKPQFTASIPLAASGAFGDAVGSILTGTGKYYDKIDANDSQGLVGGNYTDAINLLANKDDYKYNLISAPGLVQSSYSTPLNSLVANSENRGDNIVILDLELYNSSITATVGTAAGKDTSYAASYWPWCMVTDPDTAQRVWVPAGTLIPGVYAANDRTAEAWFAPAGINRGGLGQVVMAERKLTQANRDTLYVGKVNPIATFPGRGVVVFGQKTLQTQASALDRVNVRRLLIALKNYISQISDNLVFEQNTAATRNIFLGQVNPYLESVQQRQGLYAFKVVMNDSNNGPEVIDRNELRGAIYIQPTKTAEFIYLDFNILPTGAEFPA
jgi:hypothetical protein|tara:strand:- start:657 stop:2954 length:2298 start_codon:yes stop_codon:yes gene_type:complete